MNRRTPQKSLNGFERHSISDRLVCYSSLIVWLSASSHTLISLLHMFNRTDGHHMRLECGYLHKITRRKIHY